VKLDANRHDKLKETPIFCFGHRCVGRSRGSKRVTSRCRDQALRQWLEQLLEGSCSRREHGLKGLVWSITLSAAEVEQETFQIVSATIELVSHGLKLVGCHASQPAFLLDLNCSPSLCSLRKS
jgi:hypothetical protein